MQQVNLLSDDLKPSREIVSVRQSGVAVGVFAAALLIVSVVQGVRIYGYDAERRQLDAQLASLKVVTERLKSPERQAAKKKLEQRIRELQAEVESRRVSLAALDGGAVLPRDGFAGYFEDLSERAVEGLWLTSISLDHGGQVVELAGRATEATRVPELLNALADDTRFDGKRFEQLMLTADEAGDLGFVVGPAGSFARAPEGGG